MTIALNQQESVSPVDEFRTRVFWRWNAYREALSAGTSVDESGQPVTPNAGLIAHSLDYIDLFLRGHITGEHNLRSTNTHVQHLLVLCRKISRSLQFAYEEVFWLVVDAYNDLIELELYELVPTLKAALSKITAKFFKQADYLIFPEDPQASQEQRLKTAYSKQIAKITARFHQGPVQPIDYLLGYYNRHRHVEEAENQGFSTEEMRLCRSWMRSPMPCGAI